MSFNKIIGNENVKKILNNTIQTKNILHSYIFSGIEGIGKKLFAEEFAKMILCLEDGQKPCNKCKSCLQFDNDNNPDFKIIEAEGKIKIEQIRNMQEKIYEKPIISNKKVYVINNAESMTIEAQNCLLKTLEEPPEYIVIILITSNESNIINTIRSRCLKINFNAIENIKLKSFLENEYQFTNLDNTMLKIFEGSIGKALKVKEKVELYEEINKILKNLEKPDIINVLNNATQIYKGKEDINEILEYFNTYFLEKAKEEYNNASKYLKAIQIVEDTKVRLNFNSNYDMSIDNLLINIWEEFNN